MPNLSGLAATTGTVWVEGPGTPNGAVLRLDPATNQVTGRPLGLDIEPAAAVARGGGLWIAKWVSYCSQGDLLPHGPRVIFELMRVNPASMEILGHSFPIARMPVQPVFGAGAIWVADRTGLSLLRIDPHAE